LRENLVATPFGTVVPLSPLLRGTKFAERKQSKFRGLKTISPLSSNSFLPKEKGEQNSFSHREKVDCDEVARQMRETNKPPETSLYSVSAPLIKGDKRANAMSELEGRKGNIM